MNRLKIAQDLLKIAKSLLGSDISFREKDRDEEDDKVVIHGVLTYGGRKHRGFIEYSDKSGFGWDFNRSVNNALAEDDEWLDQVADIL